MLGLWDGPKSLKPAKPPNKCVFDETFYAYSGKSVAPVRYARQSY